VRSQISQSIYELLSRVDTVVGELGTVGTV
jgi:hypothetical protein